jgi:hypothetical protein
MTTDTAEPGQETDLAVRIVTAVHSRTGGRLRDARFVVGRGVVTVFGAAPSFYLKQLALEAARAALCGLPFRLFLEVTVRAH